MYILYIFLYNFLVNSSGFNYQKISRVDEIKANKNKIEDFKSMKNANLGLRKKGLKWDAEKGKELKNNTLWNIFLI